MKLFFVLEAKVARMNECLAFRSSLREIKRENAQGLSSASRPSNVANDAKIFLNCGECDLVVCEFSHRDLSGDLRDWSSLNTLISRCIYLETSRNDG